MKNEILYNKTVNILVDSYFNDHLQHGNQCGCAVGNLVAAGMGMRLKKIKSGMRVQGFIVVPECFNSNEEIAADNTERNNGLWFDNLKINSRGQKVVNQIRSTGYTALELIKIERAFESENNFYSYDVNEDEAMFEGLKAVIDALDIIHENTDTVITNSQKKRFVKQLV